MSWSNGLLGLIGLQKIRPVYRVLLGAPALLLVHPTIFCNSKIILTSSSSLISSLFVPFSFHVVCFLGWWLLWCWFFPLSEVSFGWKWKWYRSIVIVAVVGSIDSDVVEGTQVRGWSVCLNKLIDPC